MPYEIELKCRVESADKTVESLRKAGCVFQDPVTQRDTIFAESKATILNPQRGTTVFRIRYQGDRAVLTLKRHRSSELDCLELETPVGDSRSMSAMLIELGYTHVATVQKRRIIGRLDRYVICVDSVEQLGDFVELEVISEDEDPASVTTQMREFMTANGWNHDRIVIKGYDRLLLEQLHE
jgi:adenylate cyclase class 2